MPFGGKSHDARCADMRRRYSRGHVERQQFAALHPHRAEPVDPWAEVDKEEPTVSDIRGTQECSWFIDHTEGDDTMQEGGGAAVLKNKARTTAARIYGVTPEHAEAVAENVIRGMNGLAELDVLRASGKGDWIVGDFTSLEDAEAAVAEARNWREVPLKVNYSPPDMGDGENAPNLHECWYISAAKPTEFDIAWLMGFFVGWHERRASERSECPHGCGLMLAPDEPHRCPYADGR